MSGFIEVQGIGFSYRNKPVLHDVSASIGKGEILGLVGPNGAGKSTLVAMLLGLAKPSTGRVLLDGREILRMAPCERARRIAFVPQSSPTGFAVSVFETCLLGRTPHMGAAPSADDIAMVETMLERLRLTEFAFRPLSELSGGERQRVMLARALVQHTDVLVLDEPTSALDIGNQLFTLRTVTEIARERGVTAVIAIHDLSLAARFTDRVMLLDQGRVKAIGTWQETLTETAIADAYGVQTEIGLYRNVPVFVPHEMV